MKQNKPKDTAEPAVSPASTPATAAAPTPSPAGTATSGPTSSASAQPNSAAATPGAVARAQLTSDAAKSLAMLQAALRVDSPAHSARGIAGLTPPRLFFPELSTEVLSSVAMNPEEVASRGPAGTTSATTSLALPTTISVWKAN